MIPMIRLDHVNVRQRNNKSSFIKRYFVTEYISKGKKEQRGIK